jgi:hypothetical protein
VIDPEKNYGVSHAFNEVVRGKDVRKSLTAAACPDCAKVPPSHSFQVDGSFTSYMVRAGTVRCQSAVTLIKSVDIARSGIRRKNRQDSGTRISRRRRNSRNGGRRLRRRNGSGRGRLLLKQRLGEDGKNGIPVPKTMDIRGTLGLLLIIYTLFMAREGGIPRLLFSRRVD